MWLTHSHLASKHYFVDRIDLFVVRIVRSRCRISLASFFCSGDGASRVGVGVAVAVVSAAIVVVAAAVGGFYFGFSLGQESRVLVALGGGVSLIVGHLGSVSFVPGICYRSRKENYSFLF